MDARYDQRFGQLLGGLFALWGRVRGEPRVLKKILTDGKLLRIFVGEADRWQGRPLYEAIVEEAKRRGLAGATVWKGFMGFGAHSRMLTVKILRLSADLPVVVEIVDAAGRLKRSCRISTAW